MSPQPLNPCQLVGKYRRPYGKQYVLTHILGKGSFGKVYLSTDVYAVKEIDRTGISKTHARLIETQINCLKLLRNENNENVVKMIDYFTQIKEGRQYQYIVMEYCQTDLQKKLRDKTCDQITSYQYLIQILKGYQLLISKKIAHRDIKPQNILVKGNVLKIADFGLSKIYNQKDPMLVTKLGTPLFEAPQLLDQKISKYSIKSDVWSVGILYYEILTKRRPWRGQNEKVLLKNIRQNPIEKLLDIGVSNCTKHLIKGMLQQNQRQRIGWDELMKMTIQNLNYLKQQSHQRQRRSNSQSNKNQTRNRASSQEQIPITRQYPLYQPWNNQKPVNKTKYFFPIYENGQGQQQTNSYTPSKIREKSGTQETNYCFPVYRGVQGQTQIQTQQSNNSYNSYTPTKIREKSGERLSTQQTDRIYMNCGKVIKAVYNYTPQKTRGTSLQRSQSSQKLNVYSINETRPPQNVYYPKIYQCLPPKIPKPRMSNTRYTTQGQSGASANSGKITDIGESARSTIKKVVLQFESQTFASRMEYLNFPQMNERQKYIFLKVLQKFDESLKPYIRYAYHCE